MKNRNSSPGHFKVPQNTMFIASIPALLIITCESDKDKDLPPEISAVVIGNHEGGDEVSRGEEMHVNFEAKSQSGAKLDYYHILIQDHDEYKIIDDEFRAAPGFKGLMEANIHGHIHIPDTALVGSYHVTVADEDGNTADTESLDTHIEIIE